MLEIRKITKIYKTDGLEQTALNQVSVNFRKCEFASILGPSGSGKTTFLNIVGGLDHYTSGDLVVNEISTKKYKSSDWDSYRNHRIGFIFQSYNLIPHQSILRNVQLALTLSGDSKKHSMRRAKKALEEVGLGEHIHKRPNQLSGGQMQRVAIARAFVNDPEILLADEPTGALDSKTSIQIMELLKKIAEKRLVIMVTHNPELAEKYSSRIITLKDGKIIHDTNPYDGKINTKESKSTISKKARRTKMSFKTALGLSFNNLMTKKGRTALVAFAGSIGIIGIALILALSNGFQRYVDKIEEDSLTSYPLTIMQETSDMTSLLLSAVTDENSQETKDGEIKENQIITNMLSSLSVNDLENFKKYLDQNQQKIEETTSELIYNYSIDPLIYTRDATGKLSKINPSNLFSSFYSSSLMSSYSSYTSVFQPLSKKSTEKLSENYELLAGDLPKNYNELVIVLNDKNSISDFLLYSLGLRDPEELSEVVTKIMSGETVELDNEPMTLSYEDLLNVELKLIQPTSLYKHNSEYDIYEDMSEDEDFIENLYNSSETLKIVGVLTPNNNDELVSVSTSGIYYQSELIDKIIDTSKDTEIVQKQLKNPDVDIFSGNRFDEKTSPLESLNFADLVSVDTQKLESAFDIKIDQNAIQSQTLTYMQEISDTITTDTTPAKTALTETFQTFSRNFFDNMDKNDITDLDEKIDTFLNSYEPSKQLAELEEKYIIPKETLRTVYSGLLKSFYGIYAYSYSTIIQSQIENPEITIVIEPEEIYTSTQASFFENVAISESFETLAKTMTEARMKKIILEKIGELTTVLSESFASAFDVDTEQISSAFQLSMSEDEITRVVTAMLSTSESTQNSNLISLGYQDKENPTSIEIYFSSFEGKEQFLKLIDEYNGNVDEEKQIKYADTTGILMSSIKTIVDAVTYVLIGFVSISLVVSSIMIGVITYISVYERTKEIGILRAIGASKHNISNIFNAETFIIGLLSGLFAIGISSLIIPVINHVIFSLTDISNLSAFLSKSNIAALIILSVILTLVGGFVPAKSASKKDPVEALRSE